MKNVVFGYISATLLVMVLVSALGIYGLGSRKNEFTHQVAPAVAWALEEHYGKNGTTSSTVKEVIESRLKDTVGSDTEVDVTVIAWDPAKGLLSVKVTGSFSCPGGRTATISTTKTAIMDRVG